MYYMTKTAPNMCRDTWTHTKHISFTRILCVVTKIHQIKTFHMKCSWIASILNAYAFKISASWYSEPPSAAYSPSDDDSVTCFWVLQYQQAHAPSHIITPPGKDSHQLPYWCSLNSQRLSRKYLHLHLSFPLWNVMLKSEVPLTYARLLTIAFEWINGFWCGIVPCNRPNRVWNIRTFSNL